MTRAGRLALLAASAAVVPACAAVFGLDAYRDATQRLCEICDNLPDCQVTLNDSLASADDDEVAAWLAAYDDLGCATAECQTTALRCFYTAPGNCAEQGEPCAQPQACCGFDFAAPKEGATCCVGGGDGACCAECRTCAEQLAKYAPGQATDTSQLCMSHRQTWEDLSACLAKRLAGECASKCDDPQTPTEISECVKCLTETCQKEVTACNGNDAP